MALQSEDHPDSRDRLGSHEADVDERKSESDEIDKSLSTRLEDGSPSKPTDVLSQKAFPNGVASNDLLMQLEMLRGKLARRNEVLEVIRRAYYRDVIVIKEELHQKEARVALRGDQVKASQVSTRQVRGGPLDGGLSSVPSVDLREVLPLFAPSETVLQVHPCETCGGHLELVHGERKELKAARQEMVRAVKKEQEMRAMVQQLRSEAKQVEEVQEALQQQVETLTKENAIATDQLQAVRTKEREQNVIIADMSSKFQLMHNTQDVIDRLTRECKGVKQQLMLSNKDRDKLFASNNHLKEAYAHVTEALRAIQVEKAQVESDFSTNYSRLQEECKRTEQLTVDLATRDRQLNEKVALCAKYQQSLASSKEELASTLQRFEQTKRHLQDQLIEEERLREELHDQNLEFRRQNKKLMRDVEKRQERVADQEISSVSSSVQLESENVHYEAQQATKMGNDEKVQKLQYQLECALMGENDLAGQLARKMTESGKSQSLKPVLTTRRSKVVITRQTSAIGAVAQAQNILQNSNERATSRPKALTAKQEVALKEEAKVLEPTDINENEFEAYHKDIARMLMEIKEGKALVATQQKKISDLERKNRGLIDRLKESKSSVETLTGSMNALKIQQDQESAGVTEMMEAMTRQIEEGKRDQLYEAEKGTILMKFMHRVLETVHEISDNEALISEPDVDAVPLDDPLKMTPDLSGSTPTLDVPRNKRRVRHKDLTEKSLRQFSILCHTRAELIKVELFKIKAVLKHMHEKLDQAERKIDSDQDHIRTIEAENLKLHVVIQMKKSDSEKLKHSLTHKVEELSELTKKLEAQEEESTLLKDQHGESEDAQKRLMAHLIEKDEAWQVEIRNNEQCKQTIETLQVTVSEIEKERWTLEQKVGNDIVTNLVEVS